MAPCEGAPIRLSTLHGIFIFYFFSLSSLFNALSVSLSPSLSDSSIFPLTYFSFLSRLTSRNDRGSYRRIRPMAFSGMNHLVRGSPDTHRRETRWAWEKIRSIRWTQSLCAANHSSYCNTLIFFILALSGCVFTVCPTIWALSCPLQSFCYICELARERQPRTQPITAQHTMNCTSIYYCFSSITREWRQRWERNDKPRN